MNLLHEKVCGSCGQVKPMEQFSKAKGKPNRRCKACDAIASRARYWSAPEARREKIRQADRLRRADPAKRSEVLAKKRAYYERTGRAAQKEYLARLRVERFFHHRARAIHRWLTPEQLEALWIAQAGRCAITGQTLTNDNAQVDHIIPRARGGPDTYENARWTTRRANELKRDLMDEELIEFCRQTLETLGAVVKEKP